MPQTSVYEVETDQGIYEVEVEEPKQQDWAETVADWLPTAGGTLGGIIGGIGGTVGGFGVGGVPGAVGGATLGGAAGKAGQTLIRTLSGAGLQPIKEAILNPSWSPEATTASLRSLKDIGTEGAISGAAEGFGIGTGRLVSGAGRALYRKVLRPPLSERLAPRAMQTVTTGLEEGINPISARSIAKIGPRKEAATAEAERIIGSSPRTRISPREPASMTTRTVQKFSAPGSDPADLAAAKGVTADYLQRSTKTTLRPVQQQVPSSILDPFGQPIMTTVTTMKPVKVLPRVSGPQMLASRRAAGASLGKSSFGITRGAETEARKELYHNMGETLGKYFPAAKPQLARTSRLIDLEEAAQKAYDRYQNDPRLLRTLGHTAAAGAGLYGYYGGNQSGDLVSATRNALLAELAINPHLQATLARALYQGKRPSVQRAIGALPRLAWNAFTLPHSEENIRE